MRLYNTLTHKVEEFNPIVDKKVSFYHCGPTVYWVQHIGNLRAMVWADLIRRTLLYLGYKVTYVRNYTDVGHLTSDQDEGEDKMDKGAKREGLSPNQIADKYIKIFQEDTKSLNILPPDFTPRATEYIDKMIQMIKQLADKGFTYQTKYAVYYDVSKFDNYNQLNQQKIDLNIKGLGKGTIEDPQKKHFADFALWIFKEGSHKNALQSWVSPWGVGFPGWHIECSAMTKELLGPTIDIHMGGIEHVPVHHTNEIAQSEAANGVKFVHYWLHNEHLNVDNKKMAKSEGINYVLSDIIKKGFDPLALRYFFLASHYRSRQNFTREALESAQITLYKLNHFVLELRKQKQRTVLSTDKLNKLDEFRNQFVEAISNDFQIPQAVAVMWEMLKSSIPSPDKLDLLFEFDQVLGLKLNEVEDMIIPEEITGLANKRKQARTSNNFIEADRLRKEIKNKGFIVEDTPAGYQIKKLT